MKDEKSPERAALDAIIDELTAEAHSDDERIWNFHQAFSEARLVTLRWLRNRRASQVGELQL
jgi:hypothetical protein